MNLTPEQLEMLDIGLFLFLVIAGIIFILKLIFRQFRKIIYKAITYFRKRKNQRKKKKGYKNYKGDTWYPDGTYYNSKTGQLEKPDYRK